MCKGSQSQVTGAKTNLTNIMNRKDVLLKEIELIQAKIDKVEKTSFVIKGWVITMVTAVLALLPETIDKLILGIVVGVSVIAFWYLDAFYLKVDRCYRWKYNWVVTNRADNDEYCLDLNPYNTNMILNPKAPKSNDLPNVFSLMFSKTLIALYLPFLVLAMLYIFIK